MSIQMSTEPLTICRPTRLRVDRLKIAIHLCLLLHPACEFPLVLICKPGRTSRHQSYGSHDLSSREPLPVGITLPLRSKNIPNLPRHVQSAIQSANTTICVPPSCLILAQPSLGHNFPPCPPFILSQSDVAAFCAARQISGQVHLALDGAAPPCQMGTGAGHITVEVVGVRASWKCAGMG